MLGLAKLNDAGYLILCKYVYVQDLTPQVVWRGTDFGFLNHIESTLHQQEFLQQFFLNAINQERAA